MLVMWCAIIIIIIEFMSCDGGVVSAAAGAAARTPAISRATGDSKRRMCGLLMGLMERSNLFDWSGRIYSTGAVEFIRPQGGRRTVAHSVWSDPPGCFRTARARALQERSAAAVRCAAGVATVVSPWPA